MQQSSNTRIVCGGFTGWRKATEEIQTICNQVKPAAEEKTGKKFPVFEAIEYRSQVVAGTNYLITVNYGNPDGFRAEIKVFVPLPPDPKPQLSEIALY
jgi:cystatin-A/B